MKQLIEDIFGVKPKINNLFHYEARNSHNKIENHFYGPVYFVNKQPKEIKNKIISTRLLK